METGVVTSRIGLGTWAIGGWMWGGTDDAESGESLSPNEAGDPPIASALVLGASYFAGALVPVLPVPARARTALPSLAAAGSLIVVVSVILAFLSGMEMKRRVVTNLVIIAAAVGITFAIGLVTKVVWGVSV